MAYGERCKHCGFQEADHDIAHSIRHEHRSDCPFLRDDTPRSDALAKLYGENPPCKNYESSAEHHPGCPVFIERNGHDYVCHNLEGGCEQLIRIQDFEEDPPKIK